MGNSNELLSIAIKNIEKKIGKVYRKSSLYQTAAWGNINQPDFINQVIIVKSKLDAGICMERALTIENELGRVRTQKNAPRIIDIDILYFNKDIINLSNLTVPHLAIQLRRFALVPLNELSPNFVHPVLKKTNHQLLKNCPDHLNVKKI